MTRGLPTTRQGAETAVLIGTVGWRAAILAQILPAAPDGLATSPHPGWFLSAVILVAVESVVSCAVAIRARRWIGAPWSWLQITLVCTLLATSPLWVRPDQLIGSWVGFAPGLALSVLGVAAVGLTRSAPLRWLQLAAAITLVTVSYLVATLPSTPSVLISTVLANAGTYGVTSLVIAAFVSYLRRTAADADTARRAAAQAAELAERRRHQLLLYDSASILQRVAEEDAQGDLIPVLRRRAAAESTRIRTFLHATPGEGLRGHSTLACVVQEAVGDFPDLPIELVMDLGGATSLPRQRADAVSDAVRALLHNVRLHASARSVVIHTDTDPSTGEWELSIRDDGCGYDTSATPSGFGLAVQVHRALFEQGMVAAVQSEPGEGTVAVLRGHAHSALGESQAR